MRPGSAENIIRGLYEAAATLTDDEPIFDALSHWINVEHVVMLESGPSRLVRTSRHLADITTLERLMGIAELSRLPDVYPPEATFFRNTDYSDLAALRRERIYRELLYRYDGGLSACAYWWGKGTLNAIFFCRSLRLGADFRDSEVAALQALLPHIATAQLIRQSLQRANQIALAAGLTLDSLHQALFLIDPAGRLAYRNAMADDLLASGESFVLTSRGLSCCSGSASARLAERVAAVQRWPDTLPGASVGGGVNAFSVKRPGRPALSVSVLPVRGLAILSAAGLDHGWVAVLVTDAQVIARHALVRLVDRYGLTARESQLVAALVLGQPLPSAATLGITHETARQYLKAIFGKTGVNRQAELIRLASRLSG
jgi:DNA-binding CsgD family transcriptional regulator/PAS domain-containing protein